MTQYTHSDVRASSPSEALSAARAARGLVLLGALVGGLGLAAGLACVTEGLGELSAAWLAAGAGFVLLGLAGGTSLWAAGRLAGRLASLSLEVGELARRIETHAPVAPTWPAPAPAGNQAILDAIEKLRGEVLLTDEQRRERSAQTAAMRTAHLVARFGEELADGRLEAAAESLGELSALGAPAEQISDLKGRILTFFAERADRAILAGDFRRGQDWIAELVSARGDDPRIGELRSRLQRGQAALAAGEFACQKKTVEDMLALADYERAERAVEAMVDALGETDEIRAFVVQVKGEAAAFREEQLKRMLAEVRQYAEARQWRKALEAAREVIREHARTRQAEEVRGMMPLIEENARIEEVRQLRDRIADLIERKRFGEAVETAQDVIRRFPDTQAAAQLTREIDKLRKRAGMDDLL